MLKRLRYKARQVSLILKIFRRVTPAGLYGQVVVNSFKNLLGFRTPSSAVLGLTYACQCRCVHCSAGFYEKKEEDELTTKQWLGVLEEISRLGVPRINVSGGEALLRDDVYEILEHASKKFVVILESNGLLLSDATCRRLRKSGVSCVAVSIDSADAVTHDTLRNTAGCFRKALDGIGNLATAGVPCIMSTYVTAERSGRDAIDDLMRLARKMGVLALRIMPARPAGSFSCHGDSLLDSNGEKRVFGMIDPALAYFKGMPAPSQCGIFCKATFYISPYGQVQPCPYVPLFFGRVSQSPLPGILNRMWSHAMFKGSARDCLIVNKDFRSRIITPYVQHSQAKGVFPIEIE